jgi:hypothetical protein
VELARIFVSLEAKGVGALKDDINRVGAGMREATRDTEKMGNRLKDLGKQRRELTQLSRIGKALGGEETGGLGFAANIKRRAVSTAQQGSLQAEEKGILSQVAALRGMSRAQEAVLQMQGKLAASLGKFTFHLERAREAIRPLAQVATAGFAAITGSIGGMATAGFRGTVEGNRLAFQLQQLSREVAAVFSPVVDKAVEKIGELVTWFRSLSGQQQDQILHWTEAAVATLGFAIALPKVVAGIQFVVAAVSSLNAALAVGDILTGGILPLIGLVVAGLTALAIGTDTGRSALSGLWKTLKQVWSALKPVGEFIQNVFSAAWNAVAPVIEAVGDALGKLWEALVPILEPVMRLGQAIGGVLVEAGKILMEVFGLATDLVGVFTGAIADLMSAVGDLAGSFLDVLKPALEIILDMLTMIVQFLAFVMRGFRERLQEARDLVGQYSSAGKGKYSSTGGDFGEDQGHRSVTPAGAHFEAIGAQYKRIAEAGLNATSNPVEVAKKQLTVLESIDGTLDKIAAAGNGGALPALIGP